MLSNHLDSFRWLGKVVVLPALATLLVSSQAFAAVPAVVVDAQQTIGNGTFYPAQVAVAPNGTVYLSDTLNNRVLQFIPHLPGQVAYTQVATSGYTLSNPYGIAVDAAGDLYIGDTPGLLGLTARILEVRANGNGSLSNAVTQVYGGSLLNEPISLTVDSANTLFVGDAGALGGGAIYSIASGSHTLRAVSTGLANFMPASLARDAASNLYFVDNNANAGGVYKVLATGGTAQAVSVGSFAISAPSGVAIDPAGDLFILANLPTGRFGNSAAQVIEISAASPATPYIIPTSNLQNSDTMALDASGNIDLAGPNGFSSGYVAQLDFANPIDLGAVNVFATGSNIPFNAEFNAPATFGGFRAVTVGDLGTSSNNTLADVIAGATGTCKNQIPNSATAYSPYTCTQTFEATPQYTGTRISAIQIKGATTGGKTAILDSTPVYETGNSAAQITYPLDAQMTAIGLIQPQGITASGFDQTVYVADLANGAVYSIGSLGGSSPQPVPTGSIKLSAPSAVAMNGEGDLFIADFNLGEVVVVPTTTGKAPFILNTGRLLQHPISLALDFLGDLYIGDAGSAGNDASSSAPGYVVEVPYNGPALSLPTPGITVIFPQALVADSQNGNLWIGDGGDAATAGQIVKVPANGSSATAVAVTGVATPTDPSGLTLDAADNLYILDGIANTITVMPPTGNSHLLSFAGASLSAPSALVSSAGAQSFVIANIGNGSSNSIVYLNGNSATLAFGNQGTNSSSQTQTATIANIGNQSLVLSRSDYTINNSNTAFQILGSSTCTAGDQLTTFTTCTLNVQFAPTATGSQSEQVIVKSNGYNSGTPQLNLTGTGVGILKAQFASTRPESTQPQISRAGRKQFYPVTKQAR